MRKKLNLWALFALCTLLFAGTIPVKAQPSVIPVTETFYDIENPYGNLWTTDIVVPITGVDLTTPGITLEFVSGREDGIPHFEITSNTALITTDFTAPNDDDTTFVVALKAKESLPPLYDETRDTIIIKSGEDRIGYVVFEYTVYCSGVSLPDTFSILANGVKITEGMEFSDPLYLCYKEYGSQRLKYTTDDSEPDIISGDFLSTSCTGYDPDYFEDIEIISTTTVKVKALHSDYNPSDDGICPSNTKTFTFTKVTLPPSVEPKVELRTLIENYHLDLWKDTITVDIKNLDATAQTINLEFVPGSGDAQFEITSNTTLEEADFSAPTGNATFKVALKAKSTLEASDVRKNDTIVVSNGSDRIGYIVLSYTVYCSSNERLPDTFGILGSGTYTQTGFEFADNLIPQFDRSKNDRGDGTGLRARFTADGSEPSFASNHMCYDYCTEDQVGVDVYTTTTTIKVKTFYDNSNPSSGVCPSPTKTFVFTKEGGTTEPGEAKPYTEPVNRTEWNVENYHGNAPIITLPAPPTIKNYYTVTEDITLEVVSGGAGRSAYFEITSEDTLKSFEDFEVFYGDTVIPVSIKPLTTLPVSDIPNFDSIIIRHGGERIGHLRIGLQAHCSSVERMSDAFQVLPTATNFIGKVDVIAAANTPDFARLRFTTNGNDPNIEDMALSKWADDYYCELFETTTLKVKSYHSLGEVCPSEIRTIVYTKVEPVPVDVPYASGLITVDSLKLEKGFVYGGSAIASYGTEESIDTKMRSLNMGVRMEDPSDYVILHYGEAAGNVSFRVLGEVGGDDSYPKVESVVGAYESENGYDWTKIGSVKLNGATDTINESFDLTRSSRYVRFSVDEFAVRTDASTLVTDPAETTDGKFGFGNIGLGEAREQAATVDVTPIGEEYPDYVEFEDSVYVKFTCTTPDAEIHVFKETTDEITYEPVVTRIGVYESGDSIKLTEYTIIIAKAVAAGLDTSDDVRMTYDRTDVVEMPEINVQGEWPYINYLYVEFSCATEGAKIYYTSNDNNPDETSTLYNGGIVRINITGGGMTIKAKAFKDGDVPSYENSWTDELYVVYPVELPYNSGVIERTVIMGTDAGMAGFVSQTNGQVEYAEFRNTSHFIILGYDSDAGKVDFQTQGYNDGGNVYDGRTPDSAVIGVFTSIDGKYNSWVKIAEFEVDGVEIDTHSTILPDTARFVKFEVTRANGRFVLGNINVAKKKIVSNEPFDAASASGLKVYPNPANGEFNVQVATPSVVTIFNASGAKVGSVSVDGSVVVRSLSSGLYLLRAVSADGKVSTERVVVK